MLADWAVALVAFHLPADSFVHTGHRFRRVQGRLAIYFEHFRSHLFLRRKCQDIAEGLHPVQGAHSKGLGFYRRNHIQRHKAARRTHMKLAGVRMQVSGGLHNEVAERKP